MMAKPRKLEKSFAFLLIRALSPIRPRWSTKVALYFYKRWGMKFTGTPNYISSLVWIDGTDYSLIELGEGCTISSFIRILTHDWSLHTVGKAFGVKTEQPLGRTLPIKIGDYVFVGTGSIIMPGAEIGRGSIIGAGTVVRGKIPPYSIVIGSPGQIVGDTRQYFEGKTKIKVERHE
jgi:acetyltransferase-like isoleucine patch superfamily enzyme